MAGKNIKSGNGKATEVTAVAEAAIGSSEAAAPPNPAPPVRPEMRAKLAELRCRIQTSVGQVVLAMMNLPRYGLANYLAPDPAHPSTADEGRVMDGLGRAGIRLMGCAKLDHMICQFSALTRSSTIYATRFVCAGIPNIRS